MIHFWTKSTIRKKIVELRWSRIIKVQNLEHLDSGFFIFFLEKNRETDTIFKDRNCIASH